MKMKLFPRKHIEVPHQHECVMCDIALVCVNPHCGSPTEKPLCETCWAKVARNKPELAARKTK